MILKTCPACKKEFRAKNNRTKFCDRKCMGDFRRIGKAEIKKRHAIYLKEKMANDPEFRARRLARKKAYYKENFERHQALGQKKRAQPGYYEKHNEYCRQPEYAKKKKIYDRKYKAAQSYGDLGEAQVALLELDDLIKSKMSDYEIRLQNGILNKAQKRKRAYETKRS